MPRIDFGSIFTASMLIIIIFMVCFLMFCRCCEKLGLKTAPIETAILVEISEETKT